MKAREQRVYKAWGVLAATSILLVLGIAAIDWVSFGGELVRSIDGFKWKTAFASVTFGTITALQGLNR